MHLFPRWPFLIFFSATPPFLHAQFSYQDMATVRTTQGELGVGRVVVINSKEIKIRATL
jgi:hypothetical protein